MYYDQDSQLYYDAESGTYYEYDTEILARVKLPKKHCHSKLEMTGQWDGAKTDLCIVALTVRGKRKPLKREKSPTLNIPRGHHPQGRVAPCLRLVVGSLSAFLEGQYLLSCQTGSQTRRIQSNEVQVHIHMGVICQN